MDWLGLIVGIICIAIGIPCTVYFIKMCVKPAEDFAGVMLGILLGATGFFIGGFGLMCFIVTIIKSL